MRRIRYAHAMPDPQPGPPEKGVRTLATQRFDTGLEDTGLESVDDLVVVEEPLEVRVEHRAFATLMRTPGEDLRLGAGLLYAEGVFDRIEQVGCIASCDHDGEGTERNVVDILPASGQSFADRRADRQGMTTSSCGICGKRTIEEAVHATPPPASAAWVVGEPTIDPHLLRTLPQRLRERQILFTQTGSLHAAALFSARGDLLFACEDIGRHNAVDKVVGALLLADGPRSTPPTAQILQVSGRVSFEIVQKAWRAGLPCVSAVSGVSSLAVDLARAVDLTLVGFSRNDRFTVYSGAERLRPL